MQYESAITQILGINLYTYGLILSAGCTLAAILLYVRVRKTQNYLNTAALTCALSLILGLALARLVYVLFEVNFAPFLTFKNAINVSTGGLSMYGGLLGAVSGAVLAARITKIKVADWLDVITPSLLLFVAIARLGEAFTTLGISRPLVTEVLKGTFLAFRDEYDAYLRTYLLESAAAFLLCVSSVLYDKRYKRPGHTLMFGALFFGLTQTLFESLRFDAHLRFSFVGLQQVLSVLLFSYILIHLSIHLLRNHNENGLAYLTLIVLPFVLAAILGLEFMIDRSNLSRWLSYGGYIMVLAVPAVLGLNLLKRKEN